MRPYLITAKLMRPSNMKRFPTPGVDDGIVSYPTRLDSSIIADLFKEDHRGLP
jgi:hypothetical protein